ncbi:hypothetical protein ACHWQZ_G017475 [Mnemiopsis leidyi]
MVLGGLTSALKPTPKYLLHPSPQEHVYVNTFNVSSRYQPRLTFIGDQSLISRRQFHEQQARFQAQQREMQNRNQEREEAQRRNDRRKTAERREQQKYDRLVKKEEERERNQRQESRKLKESISRKRSREARRQQSLQETQTGRLEEEHKLHLAGIRAAHKNLEIERSEARVSDVAQTSRYSRKPSLTQQPAQPFVRQSSERSSGSSSGYGSALQRQSSEESQPSTSHIYENLSNFQRGGSGRRPIIGDPNKAKSPKLKHRTPSVSSLRSLLGLRSNIQPDRWSLRSDRISRCSSRASIRSTDSDYQLRMAQQDPYEVLQKRYFADKCFPRRACQEYADPVCWDVGDVSGVVQTVPLTQYKR